MTKAALLILAAFTMSAAARVAAQTDPDKTVKIELRAFYDDYAEDLRQHRREAVSDRYDRRGTYFLGNGSKQFATFENGKRYYTTKWTGPKSFAWKDMEFELISPNAAAVVGKFEWATEKEPTSKTCSYTGLVLKSGGQWRIRIEDESCPVK